MNTLQDPAMVEAWNELGEAHWKRGDIDTAKTCFEGAVRLVRLRQDLMFVLSGPSGQFQGFAKIVHGSSAGRWADTTVAVQPGKE